MPFPWSRQRPAAEGASSQVTEPVRSIYRWQDEVFDRTEARAMVRTSVRPVPNLVARLDREHPYEVPGIIAVPIISTSPTYKDWLLSQTSDFAMPYLAPRDQAGAGKPAPAAVATAAPIAVCVGGSTRNVAQGLRVDLRADRHP